MVESSLGILGACLPTYRSLFVGMSLESVVASVRSATSLQSFRSDRSRDRSRDRSQDRPRDQLRYTKQHEGTASQSSTVGIIHNETLRPEKDAE